MIIKETLEELKELLDSETKLTIMMLEINKQILSQNTNKDPSSTTTSKALLEQIQAHEDEVNAIELTLNDLCVNTLALYQPEARFLRIVVSILKMNQIVERIGDISINISKNLSSLEYNIINPKVVAQLNTILDKTIAMLHDSLVSFQIRDTQLAQKVYSRDSEVDDLRDSIIHNILQEMKVAEHHHLEPLVGMIHVAKDIERIADLSTVITKSIIYINQGKIISHEDSSESI